MMVEEKKKVKNNIRMSVPKSMKERSRQHLYRHVIPLTLCCSWSLCSVLCPPLSVQRVVFFCFVFPCLLYEVVFISIFVDWTVFFYFTYSSFFSQLFMIQQGFGGNILKEKKKLNQTTHAIMCIVID